jgi:hypothetical protein
MQVWEDRLWRLTMSLEAEVLGFSYLPESQQRATAERVALRLSR